MEILPKQYLKPVLHRIVLRDETFNILGELRKKQRLWDREAAIIYLIEELEKMKSELEKMKSELEIKKSELEIKKSELEIKKSEIV